MAVIHQLGDFLRENGPSGEPGIATRKLDALTSLRFFAAALIVICHCTGQLYLSSGAVEPFILGQAVAFFFVLSGFILSFVHPRLDSALEVRQFLVARVARIWPAYLVSFALFVWVAGWESPFSWKIVVANLAMVQSWIPLGAWSLGYNDPSWSVATEFAFYLLFPLLIRKFKRRWGLWLGLSLLLTFAMIVLSNALHLGSSYTDQSPGAAYRVHTEDLVYLNPLSRLFEFVLGMCVCLLFTKLKPRVRPGLFFGTLAELLAFALVIISMRVSADWAERSSRVSWVGFGGYTWLVEAGIPAVPFALLILVMAMQIGVLSRALASAPLVLLGEISFSIYLFHWSFLTYYTQHLSAFSVAPAWVWFALFWILLLMVSHLNWFLIEQPARRWIRQAFDGLKSSSLGHKSLPQSRSLDLNPSRHHRWRWVPAELAAAVLVVSSAVYVGSYRTTVHVISNQQAGELAVRANAAVSWAHFGDRFTLRSARIEPAADGVNLELVWQANQSENLTYSVGVETLDAAGGILQYADYAQDSNRGRVGEGELWCDRVHLAASQVVGATRLGLCLYTGEPSVLLPISDGDRDWNSRRLLLRIPADAGDHPAGHLEVVRPDMVAGWAWNPARPDAPVVVEIYDQGALVATLNADLYRKDLADAHVGDGRHAFLVTLPELADGKRHRVWAKLLGSDALDTVTSTGAVIPQLAAGGICYP